MESVDALFQEAAGTQGISGVDFSQPSHHDVIANGIRLHYVDWGGSGFPILFLHGGGQTCRTWDMTIVQIRDKYRCYAVDQRNHGDSEKVPDPDNNNDAMVEDARSIVEILALKSFVLVGMSMGGHVTMAYSAKYSKELRAVSIVDVTPTIKREGAAEIGGFSHPVEWSSIDEAVEAAMKFNPLRPAAHLRYSLLHALRQRPDGKWVWKRQTSNLPAQPPARTEQQIKADEQRVEVLWKAVATIPAPTLVFHGERSKVIDRPLAEKLAKTLPKGEVVTIGGASHTVQGDKPKEFVAELTRFLGRQGI